MPTVLVVDDEETIREALSLLLTDEGYTVEQAAGGKCVVEMLRQMTGCAVVLFDYLMLEGDGLYLLTEVASDDGLQQRYSYICMAARPLSRLPTEFQVLTDRLEVPFVAKPFDIDDILTVVDAASHRLTAHNGP